jgi:hypothetical protein
MTRSGGIMVNTMAGVSDLDVGSTPTRIFKRNNSEEECWAHIYLIYPEVLGSKPSSARNELNSFFHKKTLMKEILIKNFIVKIDYDKVSQFTWHINPKGYAKSNKNIFMHHLIIGNRFTENLVVDHKNGDKLDNRKENLHHVSQSQNI